MILLDGVMTSGSELNATTRYFKEIGADVVGALFMFTKM